MIIEKSILPSLVEKFIDNKCSPLYPHPEELKFKSYLKKDESNCFTIVDKENSIKCIFDRKFLKEYFSTYPSYIKLNQYEGMLIMIKKATFDIYFYKNVNKTISYRVILIIQDFDLDAATKMSNENYNYNYKNVNFLPNIEQKLKFFYYDYLKAKLNNDSLFQNFINNHMQLNAENFIQKNFDERADYNSIYKILPKGKNFVFLNNNENMNNLQFTDNFDFTNDCEISIKEIDIYNEGEIINNNNTDNNNAENNNIDDNITIENLSKLDFKSLFYKQPSQMQNDKKDFSNFEKINLKEANEKSQNNSLLLNNKRNRDNNNNNEDNDNKNDKNKDNANSNSCDFYGVSEEDFNKIPLSIQNLIKKMEKKPITNKIFEKYKNYKKFNSNEYIKENP